MDDIRHIDAHELNRLRECEKAWHTVFEALAHGNPLTLQQHGTGIECAVREIKRLQALQRPLNTNPDEGY